MQHMLNKYSHKLKEKWYQNTKPGNLQREELGLSKKDDEFCERTEISNAYKIKITKKLHQIK